METSVRSESLQQPSSLSVDRAGSSADAEGPETASERSAGKRCCSAHPE